MKSIKQAGSNELKTSIILSVLVGLLLPLYKELNAQYTQFFKDSIKDPYDLGYISEPPLTVYIHHFADLDTDEDLDLVVTREQRGLGYVVRDGLYYHENTGTSIAPVYAGQTHLGVPDEASTNFRFLDMDGDGDLDLFSISENGIDIVYVENAGTPTSPDFEGTPPVINPFNLEFDLQPFFFGRLVFADMDGDGDYDAFKSGHGDGIIEYCENIGTPQFPMFGIPEINPFGLRVYDGFPQVHPMDFDCDSDTDLIVSGAVLGGGDSGPILALFENSGTPTDPRFTWIRAYPMGESFFALEFADVNGDGDMDMWYNEDYFENIYGCGGFFDKQDDWNGFIDPPTLETGDSRIVKMADLDGDNDEDIFVLTLNMINDPCFVEDAKSLLYYENISQPGNSECPEFELMDTFPFGIPQTIKYIEFVDIDDDSDLDIFSFTWCQREIQFIENRGTHEMPNFLKSPILINPFGIDPMGPGFASTIPSFGDFDQDGDMDLFIGGRTGGEFQYQENIGTATEPVFAPREANPFGLELPFEPNGPIVQTQFDNDCDGDLDIFLTMWSIDIATDSLDLFYYENTGTAISPAFETHKATGDRFFVQAFADMDGDNDMDAFGSGAYYRNTQKTTCVNWPRAYIDYGYMHDQTWWFGALQSHFSFTNCNFPDFIWNFGLNGPDEYALSTQHTFSTTGIHTVCLTVEDYVGIDVECIDLLITGTREFLNLSKVIVYPNPASNAINVKLEKRTGTVAGHLSIYDSQGRDVYRRQFTPAMDDPGVEIPVHEFAPGIYTIRLTDYNNEYIGQFVVVRR